MQSETTPSLYAIKLLEVLEELGVERQPLVRQCGLTARQLQDREHPLEVSRYLQLVELALAACDVADLGFLVGEHTGTLEHGALGYALLSSATLEESLNRYTRYQSVLGPLLEVTLETRGSEARMCVRPGAILAEFPIDLTRYFLQEWLATWNPWSGLIGRSGPFFSKVTIGFDDRRQVQAYTRHLGCDVNFHQGPSIASFPAEHLTCALQHTGETVGAFCHQQCELLLQAQQLEQGLTAEIHRCLSRRPGDVPDMETVARQLNMTSRTLRRHLQREGTRFQDVVISHRIAMARRYLQETALSANDIAGLVGYADPANFYRTFRRLEGMAPQAYRARHQA
jgi:AraC-like DNA-binding protein